MLFRIDRRQHAVRKIQFSVFLLVCLSFLCSLGCKQEQPHEAFRPVVRTMLVKLGSASWASTFSGVVVARHEVQESFRVDGRMARRLVDVGDRVRAGQVLAALDDSDLRLAMESAQAEFQAATSNKAQALSDERRYAVLLSKNVISQSEYDLKHLAADEARARLDKAVRALDLAKNRLDYTDLISRTTGVVTKVSAEAGQVVAAGQPVVSVATNGEMEVLVDIPESRIAGLKDSQAEVTLWAHDNVRYKAVLRETAPAADSATRTYAVRFTLLDPGPEVHLGMTATLSLSDPRSAPTARIPATALFDQGQGAGVWVVDPATGHLTFKRVVVDRYSDQDVYVHGQIADGDVIVVNGVQKLDPTMTVRLDGPTREASL